MGSGREWLHALSRQKGSKWYSVLTVYSDRCDIAGETVWAANAATRTQAQCAHSGAGLYVACASGHASILTSARNRTCLYLYAFFHKCVQCVGGPHRQINRQPDAGRETEGIVIFVVPRMQALVTNSIIR